ncbi:hypothetical protein HMPREF9696_01382 [Afipia clevelandensis ATCC 49720]|uniref:Uncharacterized protein n=2 Tax=Afipia clevelandensis TaxID=1034 RepID=K8PKK2_9BRAD|nr:hypothetical protein HMPREF9696_01382 [Afipia clevelandensis ATCC 49720]
MGIFRNAACAPKHSPLQIHGWFMMTDSIIAHRAFRSRTSKFAHVIERFGLSMAGASCGLFVAAQVSNARIEILSSVGMSLALMVLGAIGFYLGIDVPPHRNARLHLLRNGSTSEAPPTTDPVELLSSAGTFLAAIVAFISVYAIVTDAETSTTVLVLLAIGWLVGVVIQIVAGTTARMRKT